MNVQLQSVIKLRGLRKHSQFDGGAGAVLTGEQAPSWRRGFSGATMFVKVNVNAPRADRREKRRPGYTPVGYAP